MGRAGRFAFLNYLKSANQFQEGCFELLKIIYRKFSDLSLEAFGIEKRKEEFLQEKGESREEKMEGVFMGIKGGKRRVDL